MQVDLSSSIGQVMNFQQFFAFSSQDVTSFGLKYVLMGKPEDWLAHKGGFFVKWERPSKGGPKTPSHELVPTSLPIRGPPPHDLPRKNNAGPALAEMAGNSRKWREI